MFKSKLKMALLMTTSLIGLLAGAPVTRGNSIEVSSVTTTETGNVWDYSYSMILTANNSISSTNPNGTSMFIFYDLSGLTGAKATFDSGTTPASNWNIVIENTSGNWSGGLSSIVSQGGTAVETDLESAPNVRFQYTGDAFAAGATNSAIGTAHLFSTLPPGLYGQFAARWIGDSGNTQVNTQSPITPTLTTGGVGQSVPLPPAVWTGLISLIGLGLFARVRRARQLAT